MWQARNRAGKEGKEDYTLSLKVGIKDKGDGKANVGCESSWSEKHGVKIADKEANVVEGDLFEPKSEADELADHAWKIIKETGRASTAAIQRRMNLGLTAAGAIMDTLEKRGWIGLPNGDEPREILRKEEETQ